MITDVTSPTDTSHGWSVTELERGMAIEGSLSADLESAFGLDQFGFNHASAVLEMRVDPAWDQQWASNPDVLKVKLSWRGPTRISINPEAELISNPEDGKIGIVGITLVTQTSDALRFESELEALQVLITCTSFKAVDETCGI